MQSIMFWSSITILTSMVQLRNVLLRNVTEILHDISEYKTGVRVHDDTCVLWFIVYYHITRHALNLYPSSCLM